MSVLHWLLGFNKGIFFSLNSHQISVNINCFYFRETQSLEINSQAGMGRKEFSGGLFFLNFKRQSHKMEKDTQTVHRLAAYLTIL